MICDKFMDPWNVYIYFCLCVCVCVCLFVQISNTKMVYLCTFQVRKLTK